MRLSKLSLGTAIIAASLYSQAPQPQGPNGAEAPADEPGRPVARLSVLSGDASVRRGDSGDWVAAALNAPLMAGDSLSVAPGGAAEIQLDYANFVRIAGDSQVRIANLDNGHYDIQLAKGLVTYRVLRDAATQPEISTPLVAVRPLRLGSARVEVFPDGTNHITVRHGEVEIYTPKGTEHAREGSEVVLRGSADDPEFQMSSAPAVDQWDTWNDQRDAYLMRSQAQRYVSQDVAGAEDLDAYGRWSYDPAYGNVWAPTVQANWAPYRNGQWVWEDYYGWTWVDADPWGWAPFHYGSWYQRAGIGWCWYPGERFHHYWWRPALVGFVGFGGGGFGVGFGFGNVGWIPLAPFEVYRPWYGRGGFAGGRNGFGGVNIVNNVNITNVYRNARAANGVTAVSTGDFQRGNFRNPVAVNGSQLQSASLVRGGLPVTPGAQNLRFTDRATPASTPRTDLSNQRFFSRSGSGTVSPQRTPFTQQQSTVRSAIEGRANSPAMSTGGSSAAPGWQRFGSPAAPASQGQRFTAPAPEQSGSRGFYGGASNGSRSLQVAPPIVQQRGYTPQPAAPSYSRGAGNFGEPGYRSAPAPSYQQPSAPSYRSAPSYQPAPSYRSAPAPSYQQPSAPSYRSQPAPSYRSAPSAPAPAQRSSGGSGGNPHGGGRR